MNANSIETITEFLFILQKKNSVKFSQIFDEADNFFAARGIIPPENLVEQLKNLISKQCLAERMHQHDANDTFGRRFLFSSKTMNTESGPDYPYKLKYGILLTWCGFAMIGLSEGVLAAPGWWVVGIGATWTFEGTAEHQQAKREFELAKIERARLRAEEEAIKAEKEAIARAEKEERRRLKEAEKQKEKTATLIGKQKTFQAYFL